jgi:hypothetical protein
MSRLCAVFLLLAAGIAGLGFYLGWFSVSTARTKDTVNVTVTMDQDKIREDKEKAKEKVQEIGNQVRERTRAPVNQP